MPENPLDPGDPLADVFEDLEQQAVALHLGERDAELSDRAHGEYADVTLSARLHASVGRRVRLEVPGGDITGRLEQVGDGWCRVVDEPGTHAGVTRTWVVRSRALVSVVGLSPRAVPEVARPAVARLGLRAAVRRLAEQDQPVVARLVDGTERRLWLRRVGADFVEADPVGPDGARGETLLLPLARVAGLRQA